MFFQHPSNNSALAICVSSSGLNCYLHQGVQSWALTASTCTRTARFLGSAVRSSFSSLLPLEPGCCPLSLRICRWVPPCWRCVCIKNKALEREMDSHGLLSCLDMKAQDVIHLSSPGCGSSPKWMKRVFTLTPVGKYPRWEDDQPSKPASNDPTPVNERKAPALCSLSEGEEEELETGTPVSAGALSMEGGHGAGQLVDLYLWPSESRHRPSARLLWHLVLPQLRKPC